jgi:hypothetical protein
VAILRGAGWGDPSASTVRSGIAPAKRLADGSLGFRDIEAAVLGPTRSQFATLPPWSWDEGLLAWTRRAASLAHDRAWVQIADTTPMAACLGVLGPDVLGQLAVEDAWSLVNAPLDLNRDDGARTGALRLMARTVLDPQAFAWPSVVPGNIGRMDLERLESTSEMMTAWRWFATRWRGAGGVTIERIAGVERELLARMEKLVREQVKRNRYGRCESCGGPAQPWFRFCDPCFSQRRSRYDEDWDRDWV